MVVQTKKDRLKSAIEELGAMIKARFPGAMFEVVKGYDPPGTYLEVHVDTADFDQTFDEIMDTVEPRLLPMQNYEGLDLYVMPIRPRSAVN